jgi:hypothetical protein
MILMLVDIVGALPFDYGVTLITDNNTQSVDLLKFPACGCGTIGRGALYQIVTRIEKNIFTKLVFNR